MNPENEPEWISCGCGVFVRTALGFDKSLLELKVCPKCGQEFEKDYGIEAAKEVIKQLKHKL